MDSLESISPLDGTHRRRHPYWCWDAVYLHALLQLLDRCLSSCVSLVICHVPNAAERELTFEPSAASAVAANIMLRSVIAAGFPLFTRQMFSNLGIQWAGTLLGCIAAVMIPIPIIFWFYGAALRQKSKVMAEGG